MNVFTKGVVGHAMQMETKFLRLRTPVEIGSRFGDWEVCWLGGWARFQLYYLVMLVKAPWVTLPADRGIDLAFCENRAMNGVAMNTFTIDANNNITAFASLDDARAAKIHNAEYFGSAQELAKLVGSWPRTRPVEIWNSFAGVAPFTGLKSVKKFTDRKAAVARIWEAVQILSANVTKPATHVAPAKGKRNKDATKGKRRHTAPAAPKEAVKISREGSKKAEVIDLMRRSQGATLAEIMELTGWQAHTVRGFVSGTLTKKLGLNVESFRSQQEERTYRVKWRIIAIGSRRRVLPGGVFLFWFGLACRAAESVNVTVVDGYRKGKRTMDNAVLMEIEKLRRASLSSLREKFREVFQEEARTRHREHLFRRIAWRLQALAEGDLTQRARDRAKEIAQDADLRKVAPRDFFHIEGKPVQTTPGDRNRRQQDRRLPLPGAMLSRKWKGRTILVEVLANGFRYENRHYTSLSAIAVAVTGTRWNGLAFFGLTGSNAKK
jgi:Protein of unknown function (DUF2924)/Protein of unknown function (DUF3489)